MKKSFIITLVLIGIFLVLQIRSFKKVEFLVQRTKPANILAELRTFQIANEELRAHLAEEEKTLEDVTTKVASESLEEEINKLRLFSGEDAVQGEGIEVILNQPVQEFWISDLIAQSVSVGAEAVSVNDVRLTPQTAGFRAVGGGLLMRSFFWKPPLHFEIIGPKKELKQAVTQAGGIIDKMQANNPGLHVTVKEKDIIKIPALSRA